MRIINADKLQQYNMSNYLNITVHSNEVYYARLRRATKHVVLLVTYDYPLAKRLHQGNTSATTTWQRWATNEMATKTIVSDSKPDDTGHEVTGPSRKTVSSRQQSALRLN